MCFSFPAPSSPPTQEGSLAENGYVYFRTVPDLLSVHCHKASLPVEYVSLQVPKTLASCWHLTLGWLCLLLCLEHSCHLRDFGLS